MTPEKWEKVKVLFEAALEQPAQRRLQYISDSNADEDLRKEVIRLLSNFSGAGSFMEEPAEGGFSPGPLRGRSDGGFFPADKVLAQRFKIIQFLAKGGMGEVYEAEDLELRERVAVKVVRPELLQDEMALQRFKREVHLAKKVTHPNVCRVFDLFRHQQEATAKGASEDFTLVSMELLEGDTLAARIRGGARFTPEEALPIVSQIAGALDAAHQAGVVHRDLKPGNIILVQREGSGERRVVITDFGLAVRFGGDATVSGDVTGSRGILGTPAYMSPEQIEGRELSSASDIYAFGLVIYEMLTGTLPFSAETPLSMALRRVTEAPPSPRALAPNLNAQWESAVLRCLERDPAKRFRSAGEAVRALEGVAGAADDIAAPAMSGWVWVPVVGVMLAIGAGIGYYATRSSSGATTDPAKPGIQNPKITPRPSVAVLGFRNLSGRAEEAWLSTTLAETIDTELGVGEKLRTIPRENVARMKNDLALPEAVSYAPDTLQRIRNNLGTDYVIGGAYVALGKESHGQIRLDVRLQDTRTGETVASVVESGKEADVNELFAKAGADLRAKLGVNAVSAQEEAAGRAALASNPEAARDYAEGLDKLRKLDYLGARDSFEKAVTLEPNFAMGHYALASAWSSLFHDGKAKEEIQIAFNQSAHLSREDRLNIEARLHEASGERDRAVEIYKALFDFFPDNIDYGLHLVGAQAAAGKSKEALLTVKTLRVLPAPQRDDARIDLAEEDADYRLGDFKNGYALAVRAGEKAQRAGSAALFARARHEQGSTLRLLGDTKGALAAFADAEHFYIQAGNRSSLARVMLSSGIVYKDRGEPEEAKRRLGEGMRIAEEIGDKFGVAAAADSLASIQQMQGDLEGAKASYGLALKNSKELGFKNSTVIILEGIGGVLTLQGDFAGAVSTFEESLSLGRELADRQSIQYAQYALGTLWVSMGRLDDADQAYLEAIDVARQIGQNSVIASDLAARAGLLETRGDLEGARELLEEAMKLAQASDDKSQTAWVDVNMGTLSIEEGHADAAEPLAKDALKNFEPEKAFDGEGAAWGVLARAALEQNKVREASEAVAAAETAAKKSHDEMNILAIGILSARARAASGSVAEAKASLQKILAQSAKMQCVQCEFDVQLALGEIAMKPRATATGKALLASLQKEATAKGFLLVAHKAAVLNAN